MSTRNHETRPALAAAFTKDLAPNLALPWVVRLRYGIVFGQAAIVLGMAYVYRLDFPLLWTLAPIAIVLLSNILLDRMPQVSLRFPQQTLGAAFILDTLCLTFVLGFTGGPMNPFSLLYLVQITLSAVVLEKAWTWALGGLYHLFRLAFLLPPSVGGLSTHDTKHGPLTAPGGACGLRLSSRPASSLFSPERFPTHSGSASRKS